MVQLQQMLWLQRQTQEPVYSSTLKASAEIDDILEDSVLGWEFL